MCLLAHFKFLKILWSCFICFSYFSLSFSQKFFIVVKNLKSYFRDENYGISCGLEFYGPGSGKIKWRVLVRIGISWSRSREKTEIGVRERKEWKMTPRFLGGESEWLLIPFTEVGKDKGWVVSRGMGEWHLFWICSGYAVGFPGISNGE